VPVLSPAELARSIPQSTRIIAVIPARYQSTRLPGKPLALIGGVTMIEQVHRRAVEARTVQAVLVATDDARVAEAVDRFGGMAVMTRADHVSGTDRLAEVARALRADVIVNLQGDEPMMPAESIDAVVSLVLNHPDLPMATLRRRVHDRAELENPSLVKVVVDGSGAALYFSRAPIPFTRPGAEPPTCWGHLGIYGYRREFLLKIATLPPTPLERSEGLEQLRVLEHGFRIGTVETTADTIGVDTPEDLERVRTVFAAHAHS
jgi:3-deoxy-manno-octulosonate cytidylyltransferase (CMP-KDO synthetase)